MLKQMDLFNPPLVFEYKKMKHNLDINKLDNPYIQVIWEDYIENFSQEKIKSLKQYFQKKYATTNVNVITKVKTFDQDTLQTVDVSLNVLDKNYQTDLVKNYLTSKNLDGQLDNILNLDIAVENRLITNSEETTAFKRWYIQRIEFSNFLSYGENQVIDFEKCDGITVVESDPPNFGGKTVLSVDLLMFLFFNTTTKTQKAEEIFNRFTDKNKVSVRGEITIDGEDYIIARTIERKKAKSGEWNVKTDLDFFKKLPDGQLLNFTGEQRKETEKFIKSSIGEQEDFLSTILTTATNLEDLIDSKPTARGQILSKFLGLEYLKKKEETCKEIYSEFSKTMLSNIYNSEKLKQEIEDYVLKIGELETEIGQYEEKLNDVNERIKKGEKYKEDLISSKFTNIDQELLIMDQKSVESDIKIIESKIEGIKKQIDDIVIVEPSEYYHEDQHDKIKDEITDLKIEIASISNKMDDIQELVNKFGDGIKCEHCGIKLIDAEITKKKVGEYDGYLTQKHQKTLLLQDKLGIESSFIKLKKQFDEYEKNKLIKDKMEIEMDSFKLKKERLDDKLKRYLDVKDQIEKNNSIDDKIIKSNLRLDQLQSERKEYDSGIISSNHQIKTNRDKIKQNEEFIEKIKEESEKEKVFKIYLEIFGKNGITKTILKTMMPLINSELQRLLQDSCYFRMEIRISEKNEVEFWMIDNSTGIEKLMSSGSGYERTIASLALRSVLSKVCSLPKPNIVVMDEVFGKISNENLDLVGEFFMKIKEYFEKIFVISHNPLISNWANSVVRITKVDNISKVSQ
jgi:DNA repair exonuclease SbcCD ATPase subunit